MYAPGAARVVHRNDLFLRRLTIENSPIMWTDLTKIDVTFTSPLTWVTQSNNVRAKISRMTSILQRFGCTLDGLTRQRIFQAFIVPHVLFCLQAWGNLPLTQRHLMDDSPLRCAQLIHRNGHINFTQDTFKTSDILPFHFLVLQRNAIAVQSVTMKSICICTQHYFRIFAYTPLGRQKVESFSLIKHVELVILL